jgi:ribosome-binding protein aMBF1 (putative translation factor)
MLPRKVLIEPPQTIMDHYAKIKTPEVNKPKALPAGQFDPAAIRKARRDQGLTLLQAAEEIGISVSQLSRIERGHPTTPATQKKIQQWLEREQRN